MLPLIYYYVLRGYHYSSKIYMITIEMRNIKTSNKHQINRTYLFINNRKRKFAMYGLNIQLTDSLISNNKENNFFLKWQLS